MEIFGGFFFVTLIGMPLCVLFACWFWKLALSLSIYYSIWAFMAWQFLWELHCTVDNTKMVILICGICVFLIGNLTFWYLKSHWLVDKEREKIGPRQLSSAIVIFATFQVVGYTLGRDGVGLEVRNRLIVILTQILLAVIMYLQSELFKKSAMRQELAVMNMLWKKEQEQYELSRENIALINQKCHDLKHQIRAIRSMSKEEVDAYLEEMEDSIRIYEAIVKSGNEVLDTILTEKSLYCKERGITVSCVVDGSQMEFINTIDLYAILGNALDNAIEAVEKFKHKEKRQIDVMIYRQQQFLVMNIMNPSKEKLVFDNELPKTTKEDKNHHGFGLKSIRYMVKKYDGFLTVNEEDGCFSLKILIPIPKEMST